MGKLYWEAKAYDEAGNLVMLVHNPEMTHLLEWAEEERALNKDRPKDKQVELPKTKAQVELKVLNELFDMAIMEGLTEEAVRIIWGVMPGDIRLRKPLTEEEKEAEREAFREMLREAQDRVYWKHKTTDDVVANHNKKLGAKQTQYSTKKEKKTGAKKEKVQNWTDGSSIAPML